MGNVFSAVAHCGLTKLVDRKIVLITKEVDLRWYDRDWTDWCYNEGSVTVHHPFYMIYSVADLPIKHFTAKSVWQPKKWGE